MNEMRLRRVDNWIGIHVDADAEPAASIERTSDGNVDLSFSDVRFVSTMHGVRFDDVADALAFCDALKAAVLALEPGAAQQAVRCGYCGAQQRPDGTWWKLVPMPKEPQ